MYGQDGGGLRVYDKPLVHVPFKEEKDGTNETSKSLLYCLQGRAHH